MQNEQGPLRDFWNELMRRRVIRSLAAYAAAAFVLLQAADLILNALDASPRVLRLLVILALTGAPVVAFLSWVFEYTNGRLIRDAGSRISPVKLSIAAVVALIFLGVSWFAIERPYRSVDDKLIAVVPFTVTGAGSDLASFGDGMVDLIATKMQAASDPRVVDPNTLLISWHKRFRDNERASPDAMKRFAASSGAGKILSGSIVVAGKHVVINGFLSPIGIGHQSSYSVEGATDSITWLADRLTESLLSLDAGESESNLSQLTSTSFPALQHYLKGRAFYRKGSFGEALGEFANAFAIDSTFALAGLAFENSYGWSSPAVASKTGAQRSRAFQAALAGRSKLDRVDQAVFVGLYGNDPTRSMPTAVEQCKGWEDAHSLAPDRIDLTHSYADCVYHNGQVIGIRNWKELAKQGFEASVGPDSAFAPSLHHLLSIASVDRDTAGISRWGRLSRAATGDERRDYVEWMIALGREDTAAQKAIIARLSKTPLLGQLANVLLLTGRHFEYIDPIVRENQRRVSANENAAINAANVAILSLNQGRPQEAYKYLQQREVFNKSSDADYVMVNNTMYSGVDSLLFAAEVDKLRPISNGSLPKDPAQAFRYIEPSCVVGIWDMWSRNIAPGDAIVGNLKKISQGNGNSPNDIDNATLCVETISAIRAFVTNAPNARTAALRLDSITALGHPFSFLEGSLRFATARLLEGVGNIPAARNALERHVFAFGTDPQLATYLLKAGHLAELAGDRASAARYYNEYLALHTNEEPASRKQTEQVRAALTRLGSEAQR